MKAVLVLCLAFPSFALAAPGSESTADAVDPAAPATTPTTPAIPPTAEPIPATAPTRLMPPAATQPASLTLDASSLSGNPGYKSRGEARRFAIGGTLVGWGIIAIGIAADQSVLALGGLAMSTAAPSFGHFYADEVGHGLLFTGLRAAGLALAGAGVLSSICFENSCDTSAGGAMFVGGLGLTAALTIYDWVDAGHSVDRSNRRRAQARSQMIVAPMLSRQSAGLALRGSF
jgi:hypothetical protein